MKKWMWIFICTLTPIWMGCTEFHGVGVTNGSSSLKDTVLVSEDTVLLPTGYGKTDTLLFTDLVVRPGRFLRLQVSTTSFTGATSVSLLASFASSDSLEFDWRDSAGVLQEKTLSSVLQGDNYRQDLLAHVQSAKSYDLSWTWPTGAKNCRALIALGYSPAKLPNPLSRFSLVESNSLPRNRLRSMDANTIRWVSMPVYTGDSITGTIFAAATLDAHLLSRAQMDAFKKDWSLKPGQSLYSRSRDGDTIRMTSAVTDSLFWLLSNSSNQPENFTDSILTWQTIAQ